MTFQRILIPLDKTTLAEAALSYAELIPSRYVSLLRVVPPGTNVSGEAGAHHWADLDNAAKRFERYGRETERLVMTGDPVSAIIDMSVGCDLIVMASRGVGTLEASVAQRVAHGSPVPTLVVRAGSAPISGPPVGRIVVPLDGTSLAERALEPAADLANELGVPVHLIHVQQPRRPGHNGTDGLASQALDDHLDPADYLSGWVHWFRTFDVLATSEIRQGEAVTEVTTALHPTDMIVLAPRAPGAQPQSPPSLSERLIETAPAPVVIVRQDP